MTTQQLTNPDALVKRINRADAMRRDGRRCRACPPRSRQHAELGDFYLIDARGVITDRHVSLERLARQLGVWRAEDVRQSPLSMTLAQAEATLYAARERLADCTNTAHERALRQDVEESQTRVNLLRAAQARAA